MFLIYFWKETLGLLPLSPLLAQPHLQTQSMGLFSSFISTYSLDNFQFLGFKCRTIAIDFQIYSPGPTPSSEIQLTLALGCFSKLDLSHLLPHMPKLSRCPQCTPGPLPVDIWVLNPNLDDEIDDVSRSWLVETEHRLGRGSVTIGGLLPSPSRLGWQISICTSGCVKVALWLHVTGMEVLTDALSTYFSS